MPTALDLLDSLSNLNVEVEVKTAIAATANHMVDLNVQQLINGIDATGSKIKPKYQSEQYAKEKNARNPLPGMWTPDLINTGDYVASIQVDVGSDDIEHFATDEKADSLAEKYGDILGLDPTSQEIYNEDIFYPELQTSIEQKTGLTFE